jgi:hypothetical protein
MELRAKLPVIDLLSSSFISLCLWIGQTGNTEDRPRVEERRRKPWGVV